jgi:outer membrane lipoprotein-sorting protein
MASEKALGLAIKSGYGLTPEWRRRLLDKQSAVSCEVKSNMCRAYFRRIFTAWLLCGFFLIHLVAGQVAGEPTSSIKDSTLQLEEIVRNLQQKNAQRAAALTGFEGTRVYRMQYHGFPSDHDAEMQVNVIYHAPNAKQFTVVSSKGSKFIIDHVFKKLLEGEQEAANDENRRRTALSTENYEFSLAGYENSPEGGRYVLDLRPKTKNRFLYRGKIWVDAKDFAVVRMEGEPGKNPSFWIKKTEIAHKYVKVNDFWLPAENHTESIIRLGGTAILSIEYRDYKITSDTSRAQVEKARQTPKGSQAHRAVQ